MSDDPGDQQTLNKWEEYSEDTNQGEEHPVDTSQAEGHPEDTSQSNEHHEDTSQDKMHSDDTLKHASDVTQNLRKWIVGSEEDTPPGELPGLAGRLMTVAGDIPGKYDPPVALSTHCINAIITGTTAYVYNRVVRDEGDVDEEEARLLIAALALHDVNKYIDGRYDVDFDTGNNTAEVLDYYFEQGDDFGINQILPGDTEEERQLDRADVKWLVQRTETKDTSSATRGESTQRVRGLERYCRIGDAFVSKIGDDGLEAATEWLNRSFYGSPDGHPEVHYLSFNSLEQSVINEHLIALVKDVIRGEVDELSDEDTPTRGLTLGTTPDSIAYLGNPIETATLKTHIEESLMARITDQHTFHAKTEWRSFEYDILEEIDIPVSEKRSIIADGYVETLKRGSGTDHEFETVPEGYREALPELARTVFRIKNYDEAFDNFPAMAQLWEDVTESDSYNNQTWKIGFLAELLRRYTGSVDDGSDSEQIQAEVEEFREAHQENLREDLELEIDTQERIVDRFFATGLETDIELPATEEMCFLCGRPAERDYQKGNNAFYATQSYSKRVPPEGDYKRICPVCNLEHAILRDLVEDEYDGVDEDIKLAFIYYDDFVADLGIRGSEGSSDLIRALQGDRDDDDVRAEIADPELVAESFGRQYHLQPFYIGSENARLRAIRQLLESLVTHGLKVVIGKPFAGFRPQDALLADLDPTRRQTTYGADRIESFVELDHVTCLFDILREVADTRDFRNDREMIQLQSDGFHALADLVATESDYGYDARTLAHEYFLDKHTEEYMKMREVAQKGLDLYGREYGSRHGKTKIFRRAIDATLDGLNRGLSEEQLFEHVTGQVYKEATADAPKDHYVQPEDAEEFITALFDLLEETGGVNKDALSKRRNTLSNTYLFAYDQLLRELSNSDDEQSTDDSDEGAAA